MHFRQRTADAHRRRSLAVAGKCDGRRGDGGGGGRRGGCAGVDVVTGRPTGADVALPFRLSLLRATILKPDPDLAFGVSDGLGDVRLALGGDVFVAEEVALQFDLLLLRVHGPMLVLRPRLSCSQPKHILRYISRSILQLYYIILVPHLYFLNVKVHLRQ